MKSLLLYVIIFFSSLLLVVILAAVMITTKPELFTSAPKGKAKDSTAVHGHTDSLTVHPPDSISLAHKPLRADSSHVEPSPVPNFADSVKNLYARLQAGTDSIDALNRKLQASATRTDSVKAKEIKTMAKLFESMKAEDAARILNNFSDEEAKELITTVKKRQAGKILGLLNAERAAKIMR